MPSEEDGTVVPRMLATPCLGSIAISGMVPIMVTDKLLSSVACANMYNGATGKDAVTEWETKVDQKEQLHTRLKSQ
jgi:hypothetical protein